MPRQLRGIASEVGETVFRITTFVEFTAMYLWHTVARVSFGGGGGGGRGGEAFVPLPLEKYPGNTYVRQLVASPLFFHAMASPLPCLNFTLEVYKLGQCRKPSCTSLILHTHSFLSICYLHYTVTFLHVDARWMSGGVARGMYSCGAAF